MAVVIATQETRPPKPWVIMESTTFSGIAFNQHERGVCFPLKDFRRIKGTPTPASKTEKSEVMTYD